MPVSQSLVDTIGKKYNAPTPKSIKKPSTAPTGSKVFDAVKNVGKAIDTTIQKVPQAIKKTSDVYVANKPLIDKVNAQQKQYNADAKQLALKESLKTMPIEARQALRKYAVPTKDGKFMLPSVDDPNLGMFEGLTFTEDEWKRDFSARTTSPTTISKGSGKEQKITSYAAQENPSLPKTGTNGPIEWNAIFDALSDDPNAASNRLYKEAASQGAANVRRDLIRQREEAAGFEYLAKIRAQKPKDEGYRDTDWSNPLTYMMAIAAPFNPALAGLNKTVAEAQGKSASETDPYYRVGHETEKAFQRSLIDTKKTLGGAMESMFSNDPYFHWAATLGQEMADSARIELLQRSDLNPDISLAGKSNFGDLAYYTTAFASAIPHFVGSTIASGAGALAGSALGGPLGGIGGTAAGAYAYSSSIESGSMYNQMLEAGYSLQEANDAARIYGTIAGALDAIMPGELGGKVINGLSKKMLVKGLSHSVEREVLARAKDLGFDILKEGGTEAAQQFMQNVVMNFYGENGDIWDNVVDSFVGGAAVGGVVSLVEPKGPSDDYGADKTFTNVAEGIGQETTNDETMRPEPVNAGATSIGETVREIEQSITEAQRASAAYDAAVNLGDKLIANGVPAEEIIPLQEEARKAQSDLNDATQIEITRHIDATKEPVVENETVKIEVGKTPTNEFSANGAVAVGDENLTIPFSADRTFPTKEEAVMNSVTQLKGWLTQQLGTAGITNEKAVQDAIRSLDGVEQSIEQERSLSLTEQYQRLSDTNKERATGMEKYTGSRGGDIKAIAMKDAAILRKIRGQPTSTELNSALEYLNRNHKGKSVTVDGHSATVENVAFGKVRVRFDDGTVQSFDANKIQAPIATKEDAIAYLQKGAVEEASKSLSKAGIKANIDNLFHDSATNADQVAQNTVDGVQFTEGTKNNTKTMSNGDAKLMEEAKKYKTAEEFINALGTPLYHGTNRYFDNFDIGKVNKARMAAFGGPNAVYFSSSKDVADDYSKAAQLSILPRERTLEILRKKDPLLATITEKLVDLGADHDSLVPLWKEAGQKERENGIDYNIAHDISESIEGSKTAPEYQGIPGFGGFDPVTSNFASLPYKLEKIGLTRDEIVKPRTIEVRIIPNTKIKRLGYIQDIYDAQNDEGKSAAEILREQSDMAKSEGFDGIEFQTDESVRNTEEVAIWNLEKVKTEAQLRKIWDGANEEPKTTPKQEETNKLVSRVSERMTEMYPELGEATTYEKMGIKDEIEKAAKGLEKNKEDAYRIAMGVEEVPAYEETAMNIVMSEQALKEGNYELASQLIKARSLRQTERGQSIVLEKASVNDNSPQRYMTDLLRERFNQVGKKYLTGVSEKLLKKSPTERVNKIIKDQVKEARETISKKKRMDIQQAQDFIASLACK